MNLLAPAPYASFQTRSGSFSSDANGMIANIPTGQQLLDLLESGCLPLVASPFANFRNLLDGGDFTVNPFQRNIPGLASGGVISAAITNTVTYFADRWFALGGASSSILMAAVADTTVPGFSQSLKISRSVGNANIAPIQFGQVIETADAIKCQGQLVTYSFWARQGANYSGGNLSAQLISGTGNNQSAANMVAGSWTGQSNVINTPQAINTSMTRYSFSGVVPLNCTQLGVLCSFTPSGTAGADDSVTVNGEQFEIGGLSPFEHRDIQVETEICQRYGWVIAEPANAVIVGAGTTLGANAQSFYMASPVQFIKAPTVTLSAGSFKVAAAAAFAAATSLTAGTTHTPNAISVNTANTAAAGVGALLAGGGGSGYIMASADF